MHFVDYQQPYFDNLQLALSEGPNFIDGIPQAINLRKFGTRNQATVKDIGCTGRQIADERISGYFLDHGFDAIPLKRTSFAMPESRRILYSTAVFQVYLNSLQDSRFVSDILTIFSARAGDIRTSY